jgi:hypothetical protein
LISTQPWAPKPRFDVLADLFGEPLASLDDFAPLIAVA